MASSCEASCISDPNFAVICAFLERFASSCGIEFPTFVDLQEMLENVDQVPQELVDLHIKLLRKARKTVFIEKWERALIKFCHTYSSQDGWEIERFGYKKSRLEVKIRVLKMLLEGQFDLNQKFKAQINTQESGELRTKPLGKDKLGRLYWLQTDPISNIRVYREDMDEESWTLVAKDRASLVELLQELSGESPLDLNLLNEDSASLDVDKPVTDTGQNANEDLKDEDGDEKVSVNGEVNGEVQEQQLNGVSEEETPNGVPEKETLNSDANKEEVNDTANEEAEVGEAIEEPVMYVTGEGAGADCDAGNPDKEDEQSENVEESTPNTSEHDVPSEKQKPAPKLWSIDTICGVNSAEVNEVKHKNFSSFSIDSVLEKKDSDATVSKYAVNCPFESNSVGGEQTNDVNLKTETNSDAVPYRETSVSESIVCTSSEDKNEIKSNSETAGSVDASVVKPNLEVPPVSNKSDIDISKKLEDIDKATAKSDEQETSVEVEKIESASNSETDKLEETAKSEKIIETIHETKATVDEEKDPATVVEKADSESKDLQENAEKDNEESKNDPETITATALEEKIEEPTPVEEKEGATVDVPKSVEEKIETLNISEGSKDKEETDLPIGTQTDTKLENEAMEIDEKVTSPETTVEKAEEEISKSDEVEKPEQKETNETQTTEKSESIKENVTIAEEVVDSSKQNVPEEIKSVENKNEEGETAKLLDKENSGEEEPEKKLKKQIDLTPVQMEIDEAKEKPVAIEESVKPPEEAVQPPTEDVQPPAKAESEPMEIDEDEKIAEEKSVKDEQPTVEEKDASSTREEPVLKVEKIEEKKMDENIQKEEEQKLESIKKDEEEQEELKKHREKEPVTVEGTKKPEEEEPTVVEASQKPQEDPAVIEVANEPKEEPEVVKVATKPKEEKSEIVEAADKLEEIPAIVEVAKKPEEEESPKKEEKLEVKEEEFPKDAKTDEVKTEKIDDETSSNKGDGVAKQEDIKEEVKETESDTEAEEDKNIKPDAVAEIEKIETAPDIQNEEEKETDNDKPVKELTPKKLTRSSAKDDEKEKDETKPEKQEGRRLSRNRRVTEENTNAEETQRSTRGRRKSVNLEETPKPTKGRRGRAKAKEEESVEVEEDKNEPSKDDEEKSEEESEENDENEKDKEQPKPQARRGRRRKNRRRRIFTLQKRKVQKEKEAEKDEDEKDEKKGEEDKDKENRDNQEKKERKRRRKRDEATLLRDRAAQELKLLGATEDTDTPTVRQSRRIAQIKLKEEAERRRLEALQLESFKKEKDKKGKKKKSKQDSDSGEDDNKVKDDDDDDSDDELTKKERKRRKKKDKLKFNELNPWLSSTESSTVDEEEEELEDEPHEDDELVFKSDHEFSPESDVEDPDYKPIKRARTAKVEESEEKGGKYDDTSCEKCGNNDHPEWILLCDKCDKGWHASCVRPALMVVPEGDWFCPPCEHVFLIEKLKESLAQYDRTQKQRENEELRRKRLAFVGISLDNVLPPVKKIPKEDREEEDENSGSESSSESESSESDSGSSDSSEPVYQLRERRSNVTSYRYNEYDELIKSALKDEIEAVKGAGNAGRGKDINNIVNAEKQKDDSEEEKSEPEKEEGAQEEKPKKSKKDEDGDYDVETEEEEEEEDENVVDELPPVVPKNTSLKKKKSKSVKITSLDFTSEEEDDNNSDSDFKGTDDEEESECSLPSESDSSEEIGRRRKGYDGPVRRSTRARVSRYDRDFINDDSEDDEPKRKRQRSWDSSESSDSDRSWGKKKRKKGGSNRVKRPPSEKKKKKKQKKRPLNSDDDEEHRPPKKHKSKKVIYGGIDDEPVLTRRTRGKKINYQEMNGSDSEDEQPRKTSARVIESDDDFVAENDKDEEEQNAESEEIESGVDEDENTDEEKEKKPAEKKQKILEKIKKKKWVIPDPDDFSEDDLMEEKQLDELNEELEDLDEEEEEILGNMLEKGDVPINELRDAVKRAKEERRQKNKEEDKNEPETLPRTYPPIPAHMEFGGGKFPKIGKIKITPSRAELASMGNLPPPGGLHPPGFNATGFPTPEKQEPRTVPSEKGLVDPNIPANHSKPEQRPYPYQMEGAPPAGPLTMMAMMNSQQGGDAPIGAKNGPPQYPYQGYPPNIPTTVMGISDIEAQGKKKPTPKIGTKMKKKPDDPSLKDGDDTGSGDEFKMDPKGVRGRGKKPEEGVSTVQPPTQFPPSEGGSVITRMLNAPQYESNQFVVRNPPFRPIHFATPPRQPPPIRVRVPGPMFHPPHPHDPSPSGGGPINIPTTKPTPPPVPVMQRFPDPRFALQGTPSRPEFSTFGNYYGNYPQPEEPGFQNPPPSYPEQFAEGAPPPPKTFEDETGGEFGGLASYFASQREEDLDT